MANKRKHKRKIVKTESNEDFRQRMRKLEEQALKKYEAMSPEEKSEVDNAARHFATKCL